MKKILLFFWLFGVFLLYGQEVRIKVTENVVLGKNLLNGADITGETHQFSYPLPSAIYRLNIDTVNHDFTVQLRETGYRKKQDRTYWGNDGKLLRYSCEDQKIKWQKGINYTTDYVLLGLNSIVLRSGKNSYQLDMETGETVNTFKAHIYFIDTSLNMAFAYTNSSDFCAINLADKKQVWTRKIESAYGWNDFFYLNDSTIMIVAAGLHTINLKTGKGFDYNTVTGKIDLNGGGQGSVIGAMLFGLIGAAIGAIADATSQSSQGNITGAISNILIDSNYIYMASVSQMAKLNRNTGAIIWKQIFKDADGSKSTIFINDTLIYLVNSGYAYKNGVHYNFGNPFIAAYSKNTGKQLYINYFHRIEQILNFRHLEDNNLFLLLRKRLIHFNLQTGTIVAEKEWDDKRWGEFLYLLGDEAYIVDDNRFENIASESTRIYALTKSGNIIAIDHDLDYYTIPNYNKLVISYLNEKSYKFIAHKNKTYMLDKKDEIIAEIEANANSILINKMLYNFKNNTVSIIDLTDILIEDTQ